MEKTKRISAFYENIRTGAVHDGISMVKAVSALCSSGLQGIYISYASTLQYADEIAEVVAETGVEITGLHAWISFSKDGTEARDVIDQAARLGTDHVLIVPVCDDNDVETLVAGMQDAVRYGMEKGIQVFMEDLDAADSSYNSMNGLQTFMDRIPELKCCFDTGNWIMHGEDEVEAFRQFRNRICAMHLKDRRLTAENPDDIGKMVLDGTCRYPSPVGRGVIRIQEILKTAGDWPLIVELYGYSPSYMLDGIKASIEWLRRQ